jgi:hypothetical protein
VNNSDAGEAAKAVVRRNTEEVQGGGDLAVFDELFADDFVDHTPQPGTTPDKDGVWHLYTMLRQAFPDFRAGGRRPGGRGEHPWKPCNPTAGRSRLDQGQGAGLPRGARPPHPHGAGHRLHRGDEPNMR